MSVQPPFNPYRPGSGEEPPYFAGRQEAFITLRQARDAITAGGGSSPIVVSGLRGIGKTTLLAEMRDRLEKEGWLVSPVVPFSSKRRLQQVWKLLHQGLRERDKRVGKLQGKHWNLEGLDLSASLKATAATGGVGSEVGAGASGHLNRQTSGSDHEQLLLEIKDLARWVAKKRNGKTRTGVVLFLDECQDARRADLMTLADAGQDAVLAKLPLLIVLAGLPTTHDQLAKARSFATRFPPVPIEPLSASEAMDALQIPAQEHKVVFENDALDVALRFAQGVAYHIQVIGQKAWEHQDLEHHKITKASVQAAMPAARSAIRVDTYLPRWCPCKCAPRRRY